MEEGAGQRQVQLVQSGPEKHERGKAEHQAAAGQIEDRVRLLLRAEAPGCSGGQNAQRLIGEIQVDKADQAGAGTLPGCLGGAPRILHSKGGIG